MRIGVGAQLLSYPLAQRGGLGTYMRGILPALPQAVRERGHELHIFWGREGPALAHELGMDREGATHHISPIPLRRPQVRLPWEQLVLPSLARHARVEVFHFLDHVMWMLPGGPRTIVSIHEAATIRMPETFGRFRGRWKKAMALFSARNATRVIANSEWTRQDLIQLARANTERVRVVYYGLNPAFRPVRDQATLEAVRSRYGLPERFLVFVGTIEPRKNVDRIYQAYALARQRFNLQVPLVVAGQKGWQYQDTLEMPDRLGIRDRVHLPGYIPQADLPAVFSQCQALVFPTLYEGFGLPILEAMACGAPVITSAVSSMPEVMGGVGLLVDPLSVEEIAEAMQRMTTDGELRARLAEEGPRRAGAFTWERAARETVAVYEAAAAC